MAAQMQAPTTSRRPLAVAVLVFVTALASIALAPAAHAQQFPPTAEYVGEVYGDLLERDAEPAAVEFWSNFLDSGRSQLAFTSAIVSSPEYHRLLVREAYQQYLGRAPEAAGLQFWVDQLAVGLAPRDMEAHLFGADEYFAAPGGTASGWVRAVYVDVLERQAGDGEVASWAGVLADGVTRPAVAAAILASQESRELQVVEAYQELLVRAPDGAGLAAWTAFLASASEPEMLARIAASEEYVSNAEAGVRMLAVYFLLGALDDDQPGIVPVARGVEPTEAVLTAALQQLLAGPTTAETASQPAVRSAIPAGTTLLGATVQDGVATVDLSGEFEAGGGTASMFGRLAQVVYTATQFPTVRAVDLHIDGQDRESLGGEGILLDGYRTRTDFLGTGVVPDIFVNTPIYGGTVADPVRVAGMTNVFEGMFTAVVVDADGRILTEVSVAASQQVNGVEGWRRFDVTIDYAVPTTQRGALIVFDNSPATGQQTDVREYPIRLTGS